MNILTMASWFRSALARNPKQGWTELEKNSKAVDGTDCVTFRVESAKFLAHKEILAKASVVFAAMFFGQFREAGVQNTEIRLPDMTSGSFRILLNIIYWEVGKLAPLTMEEALSVYYAVRKYDLVQEPAFLKFIHRNVNPENVLLVLIHAEFYEWRFVKSKCWSIIERNTKKVVETKYFEDISWKTLNEILGDSRLTISEFDLFRGVQRWVVEERRRKPRLNSNIEAIGSAIYKLRFPLMTRAQFESVEFSGFLRREDLDDLKNNFLRNQTFERIRRMNVCACRRLKRHCLVCQTNLGNDAGQYIYRFFFPANSDGLIVVDFNPEFMCECWKRESCPAFPNRIVSKILSKEKGAVLSASIENERMREIGLEECIEEFIQILDEARSDNVPVNTPQIATD